MNIPRLVIAGTNSGCGKTTVATGLMALLTRKGYQVQPYKVGPDYIDPMFHRFVTGRASRNLDAWMMEAEILRALFLKNAAAADIALIEGVMGFYDGLGGTSPEASTAHVARLIQSPVLLVVNAAGMSLSIAALIKGYQDFIPDSGPRIQGVVLNNIKSESHYALLQKIIAEHNGIKVLGYLPQLQEVSLPSRHLGLVPQVEQEDLHLKIDRLVQTMERTIDCDGLLAIAGQAEELHSDFRLPLQKGPAVKIAVAQDRAFNFYYRDNLDLLEDLGAELSFFSPMADTALPAGISGLYLGGGYPEMFAAELQENLPLRRGVRTAIEEGLPVYAECGGMMYLCEAIIDGNDNRYEMCGIFPFQSKMTAGLRRFGYVSVAMTADNVLGAKGDAIRGHEFHYSELLPVAAGIAQDPRFEPSYQIRKKDSAGNERIWEGGLTYRNVLAGYPHLHFWSNPQLAARFVQKCRVFQGGKR